MKWKEAVREFELTIETSYGTFTTRDWGYHWIVSVEKELWLLLSKGQFIFENAWELVSKEDDEVLAILESDDGKVYARGWVSMDKLRGKDRNELISTILDNITFYLGRREDILLPWEI